MVPGFLDCPSLRDLVGYRDSGYMEHSVQELVDQAYKH
jgi:hypothetical protein